MPGVVPQIFVELLDFDAGDDEMPQWNPYSQEETLRTYLATRLIEFSFCDDDRKKDQAIFKFRNSDFALLDAPAFVKGQKLLVAFGWPGAMSAPRRVVVVGVKGGDPVEVTCHCTLELLDLDPVRRRAEGKTDSAFVRMVAAEHNYKGTLADIEETTVVREVIVQPNITDARMLHKMAVNNGFVFYIDGSGLHWHRRRTDLDPIRQYIYQTDPGVGTILEAPKIEVNLNAAIKEVRVLARDPITGKPVVGKAGSAEADQVSLGNEDMAGDLGTEISNRIARATETEEHAGGIMTQAEADSAAAARYRETAAGRYKMELKVIGDAEVPAKSVVDVYGVAASFDGLYYVQAAEHNIQNGSFTTVLKLQKDSLREVKAAKKAQQKGARHPRVNGGPVSDPQKLVRVLGISVNADGEVVPGNTWSDPASLGTVLAGSAATWTDIAALSRADQQAFLHYANQTALPDQ